MINKIDFIKNERLQKQINFVLEIDEMKRVLRRNVITDLSRRENDAEHSWHLAVMAMLLEEYSAREIDISRVIKIALVHDLVEVYAGDTFAYDEKGNEGKLDRESAAADKLFSILEPEQGEVFRSLWNEFEEMSTPESLYANAMDRLQPILLNYVTDGYTWKLGDVHVPQILKRMDVIRTATPELWIIVEDIIEKSLQKGILKP